MVSFLSVATWEPTEKRCLKKKKTTRLFSCGDVQSASFLPVSTSGLVTALSVTLLCHACEMENLWLCRPQRQRETLKRCSGFQSVCQMGCRGKDNLRNMWKLIHTYRTCSISPASGCLASGHGSGAHLTGMQTFLTALL